MKLSAIILAKDGDDLKLKKAVESVKFADEVIVVKEKFSIKDFSEVRNRALNRARGEWVLFVDEDELISDALASEIKSQISNLKSQNHNSKFKTKMVVGFYIKRNDYFLGRWLKYGETANVRLLRLAKKDAGQWVRPVHEVWKVEGNIGELKNPLLHYSHESVQGMVEKLDKYSGMEAEYRKRGLLNCYIVKLLETKAVMELISYPLIKFVHNYIFRLGFLDGMEGFIHAGMMSGYSFLVRAKLLRKKQKTESRKQ